MQLQTGTLLHQEEYRILSVLGQGGFGITYLGLQQGLERRVAIKEFFMKDLCNRNEGDSQVSVLSEGARQQVDRFRQKFLKEAKTLAALDNPHIIRIYNVFEENGTAYYVMEYIEDGSLKDLVSAHGPLPEAEALGYIRQLADALEYLHRQKILHLDLKPANVLLKGGQTAVLIDFGISKRYDEEGSQTSSTPAGISRGYAPLEQYNAGGVSRFQPCTDIYSLGATLYTLLTGEVPPAATDVNNDGLPALPSHISAQTARAIEKAMSPRPKDRPQSVEEFMKLLQSVDEEATKPGEGKATPKERQKKSQPRKLRKIIGGMVAAMVVIAGLLAIPFMKNAPKEVKEVDYTPLFTPYKDAAGKYGYVGITGKEDSLRTVVIPAKYKRVGSFNEGLARVELNWKWGYINKQGQEVVPPKYSIALNFNEGLAKVLYANGDYGYINRQGEEIVPPRYHAVEFFCEGLAQVKLNEKWGYINQQGEEIVHPKYDVSGAFCNGFARIKLNGKWGLINKSGEEIVPPEYDGIGEYSEGTFLIKRNGRYGYINTLGDEIIPPDLQYDAAYAFNEGFTEVELNGKWGYINKLGEEIIPLKYDFAYAFNNGLAKIKLNEKWGYVNKLGQEIVPLKYDNAEDFSEGMAKVKLNGKWGYVNNQGQEIIPPKYDGAGSFNEGLAGIVLNGKCGYINQQGEEIVPPKYTDAYSFNEGMAKVELNGKWGYVNNRGEEIIPCQYDRATDFCNGLALVQIGNICYFITLKGERILETTLDGELQISSGQG